MPYIHTHTHIAADRTVRLWSVTTMACLKTFEGHTASVLRVAFVRAGMQMMTSGADGLVKLWNIRDNEVTVENQCVCVCVCQRPPC